MIVSWNWLKDYVRLDMSVETLTERLMMAGFNLEDFSDVGGDIAIDLEITSNRPDCLSHLGIAREVGVLFDRECVIPAANPAAKGPAVSSLTSVELRSPELCPRYIARLVQGVKVGPSPTWMQRRLTTLGIRPINNVVDITNYVLMECSQPLHAFDFDKLAGRKIVVRHAAAGEKITAIDQRVYELSPEMCVIADAERPVAIAGVMGGFDTEIGESTTNVLIEAAQFTPLSVRNTARKLHLHSDSSYRFERGIDPYNLDWASRRCAQLILELGGGQLCSGVIDVGTQPPAERPPVVLRLSQLPRILGIDVPKADVERILKALGLTPAEGSPADAVKFVPPTWRRDLTREADLIEEVARVYGYDKIPENVAVPTVVSQTTPHDRLCQKLADVLVACGFHEAVTLTFVGDDLIDIFRPWTSEPPLRVEHTSRQRENILRQSLVPSLLQCRQQNERHSIFGAQLFEIARVFLAAEPDRPEAQPRVLSMVTSRSFSELKGVLELLVDATNHDSWLSARPAEISQCLPGRAAELLLGEKRLGWVGEISDEVRNQLDLRDPATVAEIDLSVLEAQANFSLVYKAVPEFPGIGRDLNFLLDESVSWQELEEVVRESAGPLLESVSFVEQFRGAQLPANKKSYVLRLQYRADNRTLTADEVDPAQQQVIAACQSRLAAVQR